MTAFIVGDVVRVTAEGEREHSFWSSSWRTDESGEPQLRENTVGVVVEVETEKWANTAYMVECFAHPGVTFEFYDGEIDLVRGGSAA